VDPRPTAPNLMQPAVVHAAPSGYGAPAVQDPFAQVPLPPVAPAFQGPITKEQYHQEIFGAIAKIQAHVGAQNPNGINAAIQELNGKLKAQFPQYDTVMNIDNMPEQLSVLAHIKDYLNQKGIRG